MRKDITEPRFMESFGDKGIEFRGEVEQQVALVSINISHVMLYSGPPLLVSLWFKNSSQDSDD